MVFEVKQVGQLGVFIGVEGLSTSVVYVLRMFGWASSVICILRMGGNEGFNLNFKAEL